MSPALADAFSYEILSMMYIYQHLVLFLLPCSIALYNYDKFSFSILLVNFWGYFAVYINVSINFFYV